MVVCEGLNCPLKDNCLLFEQFKKLNYLNSKNVKFINSPYDAKEKKCREQVILFSKSQS